MLKRVRIISQIVFFSIFLTVFFLFEFFRANAGSSGLAWFLRLNPFSTLITSIASRSIVVPYLIIGIIVILITALLGRVFCGFACPLGSIIDLSDRILRGKEKIKQPLRPPLKLQALKYVLLIGFLILAIGGVTFPLFTDPLSIVPRVFGILVRPFLISVLGSFKIGGERITQSPILLNGAFAGSLVTFLLFTLILAGAIFDRRFWCQYVCPSGAFLGVISRFTLFTRKINWEKCTDCEICVKRTCPTRAISSEKHEKTDTSECILCGACSADKRECTFFTFGRPLSSNTYGPDISRRRVIGGIIAGLFFMPAIANRSHQRIWMISIKRRYNPTPIRPPGAIEENEFLARCITCGACIGVCPENALHPCTIGMDGLVAWNTPKLVPRLGYCNKDCTRCTEACPTGALLPIRIEEKPKIKIGTAFVDRSRCRPWLQKFPCTICIKQCPYDAIDEKVIVTEKREWRVPIVNRRKCNGCGVCEHHCPVRHESAIQIFSSGEKRIKIRKKKKKRPKQKA